MLRSELDLLASAQIVRVTFVTTYAVFQFND